MTGQLRDYWIAQGRIRPDQQLVRQTCGGPGGGWVILDPADVPAVPAVAPGELASRARDELRLPTPVIGSSPAGRQLVGLPMWLWIDRGAWRPVSRTVSVPGLSVTATAMPQSVVWVLGDGTSVTCGPGTVFTDGAAPESASPDCGHRYGTPGTRTVSATIRWSVAWVGGGDGGEFAGLETTATTTVVVVAAPSANVPAGAASGGGAGG